MQSLHDALRAYLLRFYDDYWADERARNITMAIAEPGTTLADVADMLAASGDRPEPKWPRGTDEVAKRCTIAGGIYAQAWRHRQAMLIRGSL